MSYKDNYEQFKEAAEEMVDKMTVEERASQLKYDSPAVKHLGIPAYNWWNEALHGVARAGTATVFPQAIGLAAMFDEDMLYKAADIISTEARAKYNMQKSKDDRDIYKGLTLWSPNINIFRDPRWGRGHETYGEDPYLTSMLGATFVKGLQGDGKYMKAAACAKHFAVHSGPEKLRHEFNAVVSKKDLWETYLPAFEVLVKEAGVEAVMGAYNRTNGEPCCGSKTLLKDILRDTWHFKGHVVSDCWAITDFHMHHGVTSNAVQSAALAIKSGCDLNCGNVYLHLMLALQEGLITEEDITRAAVRLYITRYKLGMFADDCEYDNISYAENDSEEHNEVSLETSRKSMVLLKNNGILPLDKKKIKNIAVIGPNADSRNVLKGNYNGTSSRYITNLEGIRNEAGSDIRVFYSEGCSLYKDRVEPLAQSNDRIAEAVSVAEMSDVVILCLGLDSSIEGEQGDTGNSEAAGDKVDISLPKCQQKLLDAVLKTNKPVVAVINCGSALDLRKADENCAAVVDAWYSGARGGQALAEMLFGKFSPAGRLPLTFYRTVEDLPDFTDYSMKGRTYRYFEKESLYSFGYGLSYTNFEYSNLRLDKDKINNGEDVCASIDVRNSGDFDSDEVVEVYIRDMESSVEVPKYSLCGFKRIYLKKNEKKTVEFTVKSSSMRIVDEDGKRYIEPGNFKLFVGGCQPDKRSEELLNTKVNSIEFEVK